MARPHCSWMEEIWDMIIEQFVAHIVECVPTTVQCSVTCYKKYGAVFNWWFKTFLALIFQVYSPIVPSSSTPSRNMSATRSLTHAVTNVMTGLLVSNWIRKSLYSHAPDPLPLCRTGSGSLTYWELELGVPYSLPTTSRGQEKLVYLHRLGLVTWG